MKTFSRIDRLTLMLSLLNNGFNLSTPELVKKFKTTAKIIQTDFKEYLIPLFDDENIYYSFDTKSYHSKNHFLSKTFLSAAELAIIAILKNKSKDKYSDSDLERKVNLLCKNYEDALSHSIYTLSDIEKIDKFKTEIMQIQHAIDKSKIIECYYHEKTRNLYPLQIKNLDGFWYLICYDTHYKDIRKYHLNSITNIIELNETYQFDAKSIEKFNNAINAYFKPELELTSVELYLDWRVAKYFLRKPLSKTQRILKQYSDGSCDIEIFISDLMEIIPTVQKYIPYVKVIEPLELKQILKKNVTEFLKNIL